MNFTNKTGFPCISSIPWWFSLATSGGIFLFGLIIVFFIYLHIFNPFKPSKKYGKAVKRKSQLLIKSMNIEEELRYNYKVTFGSLLWSSGFLDLSMRCERMTSHQTLVGRILKFLQVIFQLFSWCIYVTFTFYQTNQNYIYGDCYADSMIYVQYVDFALNVFCALHFLMRAFASIEKFDFWIRTSTLVDIFVIPNIIITTFLNVRRQGLSFLRILYLRNVCDAFVITFRLKIRKSLLDIAKSSMFLFSVWMISSGSFHINEGIGDFWNNSKNYQQLSLWDTCFFILISISTVGFGNTLPYSLIGRIQICFYLIYGIALFVNSLPEIIIYIKNYSYKDKRVTRKGVRHMIISGEFNYSILAAFLKAFKNKNKRRVMNIIVMNRKPCDEKVHQYLKKFTSSIRYFVGSFIYQKHMKHFKVSKARIAVILSLPYSNTAANDDFKNILTAISLKIQQERISVILQLHLYTNKVLLKMFPQWNKHGNDTILCIDEMRLGLLAYNCLVPGMATLMTNLMTSSHFEKTSELWRQEYEEGLQNRLFGVKFSKDFQGYTCLEVATLIYKLWDVCLLAIKCVKHKDSTRVYINPMKENYKINVNSMVAIIIGRDEDSALKVRRFCSKCSILNPNKRCHCSRNTSETNSGKNSCHVCQNEGTNKNARKSLNSAFKIIDSSVNQSEGRIETMFDDTGSFHWSHDNSFDDICIDIKRAELLNLSNHILVCLIGSGNGAIDFCNFMMPLRFRNYEKEALHTIVILGNKKYFEDGRCRNVKNFPQFFIIDGSPMRAADLQVAGLSKCHACVIINASDSSAPISDKYAIICTNLIMSMVEYHEKEIPIITEIRKDETAYYFNSFDLHKKNINVPVQHSEAFARGLIFTDSILYRCIYTIYYNSDVFSFIKTLLCGINSEQIEKSFGSGIGLLPQKGPMKRKRNSDVSFQLLPVSEPPFNSIFDFYRGTLNYGTLFEWALTEKRMLCLGIYRQRFTKERFVLTHPQKENEILITDQIYCSRSNS